MELEKYFQPYVNRYKEGEILKFRSSQEILKVNKIIVGDRDENSFLIYPWFFPKYKIQYLQELKLIVDMIIFWHGGIPFYRVEVTTAKGHGYLTLGEFYLKRFL